MAVCMPWKKKWKCHTKNCPKNQLKPVHLSEPFHCQGVKNVLCFPIFLFFQKSIEFNWQYWGTEFLAERSPSAIRSEIDVAIDVLLDMFEKLSVGG